MLELTTHSPLVPRSSVADVDRNVEDVHDEMRKYEGHVGNDKRRKKEAKEERETGEERDGAEEDLGNTKPDAIRNRTCDLSGRHNLSEP